MPDLLQRIYRAFGTGPLSFQEDSALYVDLDEARGSLGVVSHLATKIRLAVTPTCQALTGHKGSGKSTELRRLKQQLEDPAQAGGRFFVVLCDVSEDIDLNDVDFLEVLVAIVRQVGAQLKAERISVAPGYFKTRWSGLKNLLTSDVKLDEVALDLGMLTLSGALKNSPDLRQRIRKLLEPETTSWLSAANAVMGDARTQLQQRGYLGVVVVVDNLDKMIRRPHADEAYSTAEHLFINRAAQLTAFDCHLVYAIPLELAYSHHEPTVKSLYGGRVPVVPMTRITSPRPARSRTSRA